MSRGAPGGVLSTEHFKRFNTPLLLSLEERFRGASIGLINIPHTTCADDLALMSNSNWEMNLMLKTVKEFSRSHRYDINQSKRSCIRVYPKSPDPSPDFILEGTRIPLDTSTTHLGVYRDTKC
ncbi:hypothetical protein DPMN_032717 [Dreissena polymorpha]|uniref:Reverse transcriptase domain-containing protein n=1 Tax=Dreissena polymorpha TaxID=45954 RepID=A0A9D4RJ65_DREPO|nr:hypothetical protein DPMN_032717 [Dreissena polymorpha]